MAVINMAIDLGSTFTSIYIEKKVLVLKEPSVIMIQDKQKVFAVGEKAFKLIGEEPENVETIYPIMHGVIHNSVYCAKMLKQFINQIADTDKYRICALFSVPCGITEQEREDIKTVAYSAGIASIEIIPAVVSSYYGVKDRKDSMVIANCGAGYTDVALINNGQIETGFTYNIGGNDFDKKIVELIKNQYWLIITELQARELKENSTLQENSKMEKFVNGLDSRNNEPVRQAIMSADVGAVLQDYYKFVATLINDIIEELPYKSKEAIIENGVVISGGLAQIDGLDKFLAARTDFSVIIEKSETLILGMGYLLEHHSELKRILKIY